MLRVTLLGEQMACDAHGAVRMRPSRTVALIASLVEVGHSNPAMTFEIYAHRSTGQDRIAAELIGQLIEWTVTGPKDPAPEAC